MPIEFGHKLVRCILLSTALNRFDRARRYYVKYMSKDDFDNCWISNDFEQHDEQHKEEDQVRVPQAIYFLSTVVTPNKATENFSEIGSNKAIFASFLRN